MSRQTSVGDAPDPLVCETFEVSRSSVHEARRVAEAPAKPARQVTRPSTVPTPALVAAIRAIVDEVMRAHGWTLPGSPREFTTTRGHMTVPEPNRRIAADLRTVWTRKDATVAVVLTVDCGCRSVLDLTVTTSQGSPAVLWPVERGLFEAFGDPSQVGEGVELRTDHGPQFTGADVAALATRWGLVQTFAPVGRPTGNAVAERTIQTMKVECPWLEELDTAEDVQRALDRWRATFNHERPHQALGWTTPAEVRAEKLGPKKTVA